MKRILIALICVLSLFLLPHFPVQAASYSYGKWEGRSLIISDRTGIPGWQLANQRAVDSWNRANSRMRLTWREGGIGCQTEGTVIPVCTANLPKGYIAITSPYGNDDYLTGAYVRYDDRNFSQYDKDMTACHELGHVLGLNHTQTNDSCLNGKGVNPGKQDIQNLRTMYGY